MRGPGNAGGSNDNRDPTQPDGPHEARARRDEPASQAKGVLAMRTLLIPAALAAILSTSALALAATYHADGTIKAFDAKAMTLTLADGSVYSLPQNFKDPGLKSGEKVQISWEQSGARKMADTVTIVK
jgi:hypothetical protein